jgi:hypothetical protein
MSAFRGILTGFGMAAIKDKEAKDNAKMEVVKAAGLDYHTNQLPEHKKMEANRASAYKQLTAILGSEEAVDFLDANDILVGDGKDVERVTKMLEDKNIKPDAFKDYVPTSNYSDRYNTRQTDFESRFDVVKKTFDMQGSGIGPSTISGLLTKPEGDITTTIKGEPGSQMGPVITEGTPDREETINRSTSSLPISAFYGAKPDTVGVETKYNSVSKAVNEQMQYGSPIYNAADGTTTFNIADELRTTSNAHIRIASVMTQQDNSISQIDAVSRSKQELDNQTVTPFNILASSLEGSNYTSGNGRDPAFMTGGKGGNIDVATTQIKTENFEGNIRQFLENVYANVLLDDGKGNTDEAVFAKFLENIPDNFVINAGTKEEQKYKEVIASSHSLRNYYSKY